MELADYDGFELAGKSQLLRLETRNGTAGVSIEVDEDALRDATDGDGGGEPWSPSEWRRDDGGVVEQWKTGGRAAARVS